MTPHPPTTPTAGSAEDPSRAPTPGRGDPAPGSIHLHDLFRELRQIAAFFLRRENPGTLQATALVNEAVLRMLCPDGTIPKELSRNEFFSRASRCMGRVLIDHARRKKALKRTPPGRVMAADDMIAPEPALDVIEIQDLVSKLEGIAPRSAEVVRLRFYLGLTIPEAAAALDVSISTVESDWRFARACLHCWLAGNQHPGSDDIIRQA
jgi:RNA polymerase sigma factor (TIGR02999 family)